MDEGRKQASNPHGVKRPAEDSLLAEQRLAKRLSRLSLKREASDVAHFAAPQERTGLPRSPPIAPMQLDDTGDRVYVFDLDEELADDDGEPQGDKLIFLPDIERELTKIPKTLLTSHNPSPVANQLVLYSVPNSLSVPQEQDNVRRAIIEARARAVEEQARKTAALEAEGINHNDEALEDKELVDDVLDDPEDTDAMDIG